MRTIMAAFLLAFLFVGCENSTSIQMGTIYVLVVDTNNEPVSGIKITITPDSLTKSTNEKGVCTFDVVQGSYYVSARLSGPGPAIKTVHELIEIESRKTVKLKLITCPGCV